MNVPSRARRPRFDTVQRRFADWHHTRVHPRAPLPARLWAAAVALVPEHGLYATAQALGISYGALKQHVDRQEAQAPVRARTRFVELPALPERETYVEITGDRSVRVRLTGIGLAELADFARRVAGASS
jgi:hypothetical protein